MNFFKTSSVLARFFRSATDDCSFINDIIIIYLWVRVVHKCRLALQTAFIFCGVWRAKY